MELIRVLLNIASSLGVQEQELITKAGLTEDEFSRIMNHGDGNDALVIRLASSLGYTLSIFKKSPLPRLDHAASVWSSPTNKNAISKLYARLTNASFIDLMALADLHGISVVEEHLETLRPAIREARYQIQKEMLNNIKVAYATRHS